MQIPQTFTDTIAKVFQDKTLILYSVETEKSDSGLVRKTDPTQTGTMKANVRFTNLRDVQEEFGIREEINMVATSQTSMPKGQIYGYQGKMYKAVEVIQFDSHYLIAGKLWLLR